MSDTDKLQRFLDAQEPVMETVRSELRSGKKRSHWMWFVFPQIAGLGKSGIAARYALASLEEARSYLDHPVLGERLRECSALVAGLQSLSVNEIFGTPDDLKFHSCMTLFARAANDSGIFAICLEKYFNGVEDQATLDRI